MTLKKFKNWVAVIPSFILYNEKLTDKDKLVYCVISNLTHEKGYCWCSNKYIAELLNCSPLTISRSISKLNKLKYIRNELTKNDHGTQRKIFMVLSDFNRGLFMNDKPTDQKRSANNIFNNIKDKEINMSTNINKQSKEILNYINENFKRNFRTINKNKLKSRLKTFSIDDIKKAIENAYNDQYHVDNKFTYLTPEYFLRNDQIIDKWINQNTKQKYEPKPSKFKQYTQNISKEFGW